MHEENRLKLEDHASALALLAEVRDYLMRLPVVPATRQLCKKIDVHLSAPDMVRVQEAAQRALRDRTKLNGALYMPAGPCLSAELFGHKLTLQSGHLDIPGGFSSAQFLSLLRNGMSMELRNEEIYAQQVAAAR